MEMLGVGRQTVTMKHENLFMLLIFQTQGAACQ